jgi:hypothetical protein
MADAIITWDRPRGHLRAIHLAGAASMLIGVASSWAQGPAAGMALPFCPLYPPGTAPAIGPSNCRPVAAELSGPTAPVSGLVALSERPGAVLSPPAPPSADAAHPATPLAPQAATAARAPDDAPAVKPAGPQTVISLQSPGAITLDQIAAMLGQASKRTVSFTLSAADDYKKSDLTHRVRLTWTGPLEALVDQLGEIYGLDVAIDDTAIRFTSRQGNRAASASATRTPGDRS